MELTLGSCGDFYGCTLDVLFGWILFIAGKESAGELFYTA
jgi:hypothetical protein